MRKGKVCSQVCEIHASAGLEHTHVELNWNFTEQYLYKSISIHIYDLCLFLGSLSNSRLCFLIASHKQTEKTNRINSLHTFCKVWTFKDHLISDYSNDCSSSSSHSPFSVSDKTSDESDTTSRSSRVAAIINYMHGRVWICNVSCRHLDSCRVTRLFPFIDNRWPCLSLDKLLYCIFSFDVITKEQMERLKNNTNNTSLRPCFRNKGGLLMIYFVVDHSYYKWRVACVASVSVRAERNWISRSNFFRLCLRGWGNACYAG